MTRKYAKLAIVGQTPQTTHADACGYGSCYGRFYIPEKWPVALEHTSRKALLVTTGAIVIISIVVAIVVMAVFMLVVIVSFHRLIPGE